MAFDHSASGSRENLSAASFAAIVPICANLSLRPYFDVRKSRVVNNNAEEATERN